MSQVKKEIQNTKKQVKEMFDPNVTSFTTNLKRAITGVSSEFSKLKGNSDELNNAFDLARYQQKLKGISTEADKAKKTVENVGHAKYDTSSIEKYISKYEQLGKGNLKSKLAQMGGGSFYEQGKHEIAEPDEEAISLWDKLKAKIQSVKPVIQQAGNTIQQMFGGTVSKGISALTGGMQKGFNSIATGAKKAVSSATQLVKKIAVIPGLVQKIGSGIKGMGSGMSNGVKQVLRYAVALFSIRSIYTTLSQFANSWLSSQNSQAQQLNANIEYMKYAMGSALAPVIQYITSLVYTLMKAIQSVAYALTGVNIFAKATADSMKDTANNTKKATKETKQLAGVHNEINNIQNNDNDSEQSATPNIDLSQLGDVNGSILDALKNKDWSELGRLIGEKINNALSSIDWGTIQSTARDIATNIARFLNSFIGTTDWNLVGNTIAQGINTAIYFAESFVSTFNWGSLGKAIANGVNGLFLNVDWIALSNTLARGINGLLTTMNNAFTNIKWAEITSSFINGLNNFIYSIDWGLLGTTIANGINSVFAILYTAVTNFDWIGLGISLGTSLNNFIQNTDWATIAQTLGNGIIGVFNSISSFLAEVDWTAIGESVKTFIQNIDWAGIWEAIKQTIIEAIGSVDGILVGLFGPDVAPIIESIALAIGGVTTALQIFKTVSTAVSTEGTILNTVFSALSSGGLSGLLTAIAPVIAIIGALALIVYTVRTHFDEFKASLQDTGDKFKEVYDQYIAPFVDNVKQTLQTLWNEHLKPLFNKLQELIMTLWNDALKPLIDWIITTIIPKIMPVINAIWEAVSAVIGGIIDAISGVVDVFKGVIQFISGVFTGDWSKAWEGIKNIFSGVWEAIKGIFEGVWGAIKVVINAILSGVEGLANGVVKGINIVIRALNNLHIDIPDWVPGVGGKTFGFNIKELREVSLPRLAKGGVLYDETAFVGGEYSGASNNPEIVTPQNIMYDTMKRALEDSGINDNSDRPIHLTVNVANKKLGEVLLEDLRDKTRRTGKNIEVLIGG